MLPGPDNIVTGELSNGLRVWIYENFESRTLLLDGYAPGGSINEGPEETGLADLTATLLRRGAGQHDYDALNEIVEGVGAFFGFDAGRHTLSFNTYSLAEDFELVLSLLAESLLSPHFPQHELEKSRRRMLTRLKERKHSTRSMASITFNRQLYPPGHPYRIDLDAEIAALERFQREDVVRFYREKVSPKGGVVVLVGAIRAEQALEMLEAALGGWRHPHAHPDLSIPPRPELAEKKEARVHVRGKSQSDIVMGWPGIARNDPDYTAMLVCNTIFGRFGLGGRLGRRIREEMGLAYYAYSLFNANRGPGTWRIVAGVNPAHVEAAIEAMREEVARIVREPVAEDELADVQSYLIGSLPLKLETNAGMAGYLLSMAWYGLGMDYLTSYADRIRRVTRQEVLRVAQTYLHPERYALAVAGPSEEAA
jgi:zinc protease